MRDKVGQLRRLPGVRQRQHGIAGHEMRQVREFQYPWSRQSALIMHSDGLTTRWNLDDYPALMSRDPAVIAGVLWNDHRRQNDDATVVGVRWLAIRRRTGASSAP